MADPINIAELMITLHRYHRQIAELTHRRKLGNQRIILGCEKEKAASLALDEAKTRYQELERGVRQQEQSLQIREQATSRRKEQLQAAKTNKEYLSLKEQIEADEQLNGQMADTVLEAMGEAETFLATVGQAEKAFMDAQEARKRQETDFHEELPSLEASLAEYQAKLASAERGLPAAFRPIYRELVDKLGGEEALAPVVNNKFCGHCNQQIPIHFVTSICDGNPYLCQACGRLMFIPEHFVLK